MNEPHYPVMEVQPEWVLEVEAMGSKEKFWYRDREDKADWLFKYPKPGTGQHWAEKVAAEIAKVLQIRHATVELALFMGSRGSTTESFAREGRNLFHGNQILAGSVLSYDPSGMFRHSRHTLDNIRVAMDRTFAYPHGRERAKLALAEYLVLDALIANVDRHHENWGLLRKNADGQWTGFVAPTFDHASSLGRELLEDRRELLLKEGRVGQYVEKGRGGVFWAEADKRGPSPLELIRRAIKAYPDEFRPAVEKIVRFDRSALETILKRVPEDWMSRLEREFTLASVCYSHHELVKLLT
jgi:hypothetical protein